MKEAEAEADANLISMEMTVHPEVMALESDPGAEAAGATASLDNVVVALLVLQALVEECKISWTKGRVEDVELPTLMRERVSREDKADPAIKIMTLAIRHQDKTPTEVAHLDSSNNQRVV